MQFPFTLAGNFAVTLQFVSVISTLKRFLCALATVLVAVFLRLHSLFVHCAISVAVSGTFAVTLQFVSVISTVKRFLCALATVFAVLFCGCRGQGELLRYSPFFSSTQRIKALHGATRCQTSCNLQKFSSSDGLYPSGKGVERGAWDAGM